METTSKNIQLQVSGHPCQFDYSPGTDSIVAVTSDSISLHSLESVGSPRQIFYYDINLAPLSVFAQKKGRNPMVATLNNSSLCIWDSSRPTSALLDFQIFRESGIYAFDWSPLHSSLFATAGTNGFVSIWDKRTSLNRPAGATFLGKKVVQHLKWSHFVDVDIAALVNDDYVLKWDARVISDQVQESEAKPRYTILRCDEPAIDISWKSSSSFWILSSDRISQLTLDKKHTLYPVNVGDKSNTTQSFLWNTSEDLCAILSTRKGNFDTIINFYKYENDKFVFRDNIAVAGRVANCFWRKNEDVFVIVNYNGYLRFFDVGAAAGSSSTSSSLLQENIVPDDDYFLGRQTFENRWYVAGDMIRNLYGDLKSLGLVDHCHERAYLEHSAREQLHQQHHAIANTHYHHHHSLSASTIGSASSSALPVAAASKNVVGPRTFYMLLSDELRILEQAIKMRVLEGLILTLCDAFNRMLSLDCSVAAATPGSGPIVRNYSSMYNIESALNNSSFSNSMNNNNSNNFVNLTITFPKKLSHFWSMSFTIENRSHYKVKILLSFSIYLYLYLFLSSFVHVCCMM